MTRRVAPSRKGEPKQMNRQVSLFDAPEERIKVINVKTASRDEREGAVYVGRANAYYKLPESPLCNPFKGEWISAIAKYREHLLTSLREDPGTAQAFSALLGTLKHDGSVTLMCWCAPLPCHANVIKELLEAELA